MMKMGMGYQKKRIFKEQIVAQQFKERGKRMKSVKKVISVLLIIVLVVSTMISTKCVSTYASETIEATQMHTWSSSDWWISDGGITDSYGNTYEKNIIGFDAYDKGRITYDLNGEYSRFNGYFVASTDTCRGASIDVGIFADGELVYSLSGYTRQQPKQEFNIDLTGVKYLAIKTSSSCNEDSYYCNYGWIYMVDSIFTKADTPSEVLNYARTRDCIVIDSWNCTIGDTLKKDSFGDFHDGATVFNEYYSGGGGAVYNLNKQYKTFTGAFVSSPDTGNNYSMSVNIYCDDELVFSEEGITLETPIIKFEIDVTDVSVLKIVAPPATYNPYAYLYLVEDILTDGVRTLYETETDFVRIQQQPDDVTADEGDVFSMSVGATGTDLSYQWQYRNVGEDWQDWTGYMDNSITQTATADMNQRMVRCAVTDSYGSTVITDAKIICVNLKDTGSAEDTDGADQDSVDEDPVIVIWQQPDDVTVDEGDMISMSVGATGTDLSYQWQYRKIGEDWTDWEGFIDNAFETEATADEWQLLVRCQITDTSENTVFTDIKLINVHVEETDSADDQTNVAWNFVEVPTGDVNGDGAIDMKDVVTLKRYVAEWNVTLKYMTCVVDAE